MSVIMTVNERIMVMIEKIFKLKMFSSVFFHLNSVCVQTHLYNNVIADN